MNNKRKISILVIIFTIIVATFFSINSGMAKNDEVIVDSNMTFEEATKGTKAYRELLDSLNLLTVEYYSFDKKIHRGQILVHNLIKEDVIEFFQKAKEIRYPIYSVIPISKFDWDDEKSMAANNSSGFNYRTVEGSDRLSNHSFGLAIDINPFINPVIYANGRISPEGANYDPKAEGAFFQEHPLVQEMLKRKFRWGGNWKSLKDYHHFDLIHIR